MGTKGIITVAAALWLAARPANGPKARPVQYGAPDSIAVGKILIANEKLGDPNFAKSVVLIVRSDPDGGTLGLILNRRSEVPLSQIFPEIKGASKDPAYMGGPVQLTSGQGLLRSDTKPEPATHILGDIYAVGSKTTIEKAIASHVEPARFRLYLGYAGWAPGQLETEMEAGAWALRPGTAGIIFDSDPESLWSRLSHLAHTEIAQRSQPSYPPAAS